MTMCRPCLRHFNPRSHEGSDLRFFVLSCIPIVFQSTLPRGERRLTVGEEKHLPLFQSTLPRGERQIYELGRGQRIYFNPRSHEGSDPLENQIIDNMIISIHAPTRGATSAMVSLSCSAQFQSTLPRGERPNLENLKLIAYIFQSTLPRGERRMTGLSACH